METDERGEPKPGVAAITLPAIMERINKWGEPLGPLLPPMRGAFSLLNLVEGYVSTCNLYAVCVQCEPAPLLLGWCSPCMPSTAYIAVACLCILRVTHNNTLCTLSSLLPRSQTVVLRLDILHHLLRDCPCLHPFLLPSAPISCNLESQQ